MIQYILFNSITEFSIWHEKIKKEKMIPFKGTANYTNAIFHPDVLDKRIICSFTSDISLTGLTVITEEQAKEKVYRELDGDIEFGFADASEDSFSCKIKEIKI